MTIAEVTKTYAEMIKVKKRSQSIKSEEFAKELPNYESGIKLQQARPLK